jgi:hypothetical protein
LAGTIVGHCEPDGGLITDIQTSVQFLLKFRRC